MATCKAYVVIKYAIMQWWEQISILRTAISYKPVEIWNIEENPHIHPQNKKFYWATCSATLFYLFWLNQFTEKCLILKSDRSLHYWFMCQSTDYITWTKVYGHADILAICYCWTYKIQNTQLWAGICCSHSLHLPAFRLYSRFENLHRFAPIQRQEH